MSSHARYAPSSASRWLNCSASVQACEGIEEVESVYAKEGTDAHACLETLLKNRKRRLQTAHFLRQTYPLQMITHAEWALDEILNYHRASGTELFSETKSRLDFIDKEFSGTADAVVVDLFGTLTVIDYKYGKGVWVDVVRNPQLIAYALGVAHEYGFNFEKIQTVVLQPRILTYGGAITQPHRVYVQTRQELLEWKDTFREGIARTKVKRPSYRAGSWCFFCPAKPTCKAYAENDGYRGQATSFEDAPELEEVTD